MTKKLLTAAALAAALLSANPAWAVDDELQRSEASNHGYNTAALEVICVGMLTVSNAKLRAKLDRMYRENPRWRKSYLEGYANVASRAEGIAAKGHAMTHWMTCTGASNSGWLKLDPASRDRLESDMRRSEEERREKRR